jgi:hypothetical protein
VQLLTFRTISKALESGSWDVAIGANGKGMVTTGFEGSGWTPFRELNLATDTLTQQSGASAVFGEVRQNTHIHRSSDRSLFLMTESNTSNGPIFTYNATTNTILNRVENKHISRAALYLRSVATVP